MILLINNNNNNRFQIWQIITVRIIKHFGMADRVVGQNFVWIVPKSFVVFENNRSFFVGLLLYILSIYVSVCVCVCVCISNDAVSIRNIFSTRCIYLYVLLCVCCIYEWSIFVTFPFCQLFFLLLVFRQPVLIYVFVRTNSIEKTRVSTLFFSLSCAKLDGIARVSLCSLILHLVVFSSFLIAHCAIVQKKKTKRQTNNNIVVSSSFFFVLHLAQATVSLCLFCCYCSWFYINLIFIQTNMMRSVDFSR